MKFFKKHRKIFYVPGMISLMVLPILCLNFFRENKSLVSYHSMDVYFSSSITDQKPDNTWTITSVGYVPKRNYFMYEIDGTNDNTNLIDSNSKIVDLLKSKDTINGVKFNFSKKAIYTSFVDVIDQLAIASVPNYVIFENSIYVYVIPEEKNEYVSISTVEIIKCGYYEANKEYFARMESKRNHAIFVQNLKKYWVILAALLGLVAVNVFVIRKRIRNDNYI